MHRILNSIRPSSSLSSDHTKKKAKLTVPPYIYLFFIQLDFSEPFRPEWLFYTYLCFYCFLALRSVKNSHFNFIQCIFIISFSLLLSQLWKYNDTAGLIARNCGNFGEEKFMIIVCDVRLLSLHLFPHRGRKSNTFLFK